jgi:ergothioneine biosynthesis protein EgtB
LQLATRKSIEALRPEQALSALALDYLAVRRRTEAIAAPLSAEDCALQSMADASPVKWHLAHTSWFFETFMLESALPGYRHFHPQFRVLFNSYYNAVGEKHPRPERGMLSRPALAQVLAYRKHVDRHMQQLLAEGEALPAEVAARLALGLNHEQQHQELMLTDLKHLLSRNPLRPAYVEQNTQADTALAATVELGWHKRPAGLYEIGHTGEGFAFDNEAPRHKVWLNAFALASRAVTNGEYLAFMQDGGYRRPELWLAEGWDQINTLGWRAPLYWEQHDGEWRQFTLHGMQPLQLDQPVHHISLFESDAYAQWCGARLPTEFEWEVVARDAPLAGNFLEQQRLQPSAAPTPVDGAHPSQLYGDVWEWTRSAYAPYPGFKPAPGAIGEYNGKFMANQFVLRGGSCVTPQTHIRSTYRNFFPAAARWQFSGLRLARDEAF